MLDTASGGEPLHVAPAVTPTGAEGIGVIDQTLPDERDGFEPAVRVGREAGNVTAVVHVPAVAHGCHVVSEVALLGGGAEPPVPGRKAVDVMHDHDERVDHRPPERQRGGADDRAGCRR